MSATTWGPMVRARLRSRRRPWKCGLGGLGIWLLLGALLSAAEPQSQAPQPPASGSPIRTATRLGNSLEPLTATDWHPILVRDRQLENRLRLIQQQLEAGQIVPGLGSLQGLLDMPEDAFIRLGKSEIPRGAHRLALHWLERGTPEVLETYQLLYGASAQKLLDRGLQTHDIALLREVVRRYYYTAAGFTALDRLSSRAQDVGDDVLAAAGFMRLLQTAVHRNRVTPLLQAKAALCFHRLRDIRRAQEIVREVGNRPLLVGGRLVPAERWLGEVQAGRPLKELQNHVVGGSSARNDQGTGSSPAFGYPVWTTTLAGPSSRFLEPLVAAWMTEQQQENSPSGMAHFPLAVGNLLVFRDFEGIRAVEFETGTTVWSYRCDTSLLTDFVARSGSGNVETSQIARQLAGNWTLGMLSSDGRRIFAIDNLESNWSQRGIIPGQVDDPQAAVRQTNRLIALPVQPEGEQPVPLWIQGGSSAPAENTEKTPGIVPAVKETVAAQGTSRDEPAMTDYFFLGPPLPLNGNLYVIAERRQQLQLLCLRAETGRMLWKQELCALPLPVSLDPTRYYLACVPAYADGVLVCPTHAGILAAADPLTGELLWSSPYEDKDQQQKATAAPYAPRTRFGHPGYPNFPMIQGGRVVYLPAHADAVCCFDLHSGKLVWRSRREDFEQAIEYVAAVGETQALIVGRRRCRGLSLADGRETWSYPLTSLPAGRGCRVGGNYLVPLVEGSVLSLDLRTGRRAGLALPRGTTRPGNLLAQGDLLISFGAHEIHAFPQAEPWLKKLSAAGGNQPAYSGQLLMQAELELAVGKNQIARKHLRDVLAKPTSPDTQSRSETLLRELLIAELRTSPETRAATLRELQPLMQTPLQRGRVLSLQAGWQQPEQDLHGLAGTARELARLPLSGLLPLDDDPARQLSSAALSRELLEAVRTAPQPVGNFDQQLLAEFQSALHARDAERLRQLITIYGNWPVAKAMQLELAQLLASRGKEQQVELLLLDCAAHPRREIAAQAWVRLIELYNDVGLYHRSGRYLQQLASLPPHSAVGPGRRVAEFLESYPRHHPAWEAYVRRTEPEAAIAQAQIREERWPNDALQNVYNGTGVLALATPRGFEFDLFDEGRGEEGKLIAVNRHWGHRAPLKLPAVPRAERIGAEASGERSDVGQTIALPTRYYYPVQPQQAFVGHFFPVGSAGAAHGVSLLENKLIWSTVPPGLQNREEIVRVGPAGPGYAVFQCRQHLFALDPATGSLQWHRQDIESSSGLAVDPFTGLFGDDQVLVLFAADRVHYTLYKTATGAELRRGYLDASLQQLRKTFGRRLFYFTDAVAGRMLRLWDPRQDAIVWEEGAENLVEVSAHAGVPTGTRLFSFVSPTEELAYFTAAGRLKIVDLHTGRQNLDIAWTPRERLTEPGFLRVFADHARYYVNLQQAQPPGESYVTTSSIISDTPLPAAHIAGELTAVSRPEGRVLWTREFDNCSILQFAELRLPVLIAANRTRRGSQLALKIEVLQARSGDSISQHDHLLAERLLQSSYDRGTHTLQLRTAKSTVTVELATAARQSAQP